MEGSSVSQRHYLVFEIGGFVLAPVLLRQIFSICAIVFTILKLTTSVQSSAFLLHFINMPKKLTHADRDKRRKGRNFNHDKSALNQYSTLRKLAPSTVKRYDGDNTNGISPCDALDNRYNQLTASHIDRTTDPIHTDRINIIERAVEYIGNLQKALGESKISLEKSNLPRKGRK
jgi:hypothetical protein